MSEHMPAGGNDKWLDDFDPSLKEIPNNIESDRVNLAQLGDSLNQINDARNAFYASYANQFPRLSAENELARRVSMPRRVKVEGQALESLFRSSEYVQELCKVLGWDTSNMDTIDFDAAQAFVAIKDTSTIIHRDAKGLIFDYEIVKTEYTHQDDGTDVFEARLTVADQHGRVVFEGDLYHEQIEALEDLVSIVADTLAAALEEEIVDRGGNNE